MFSFIKIPVLLCMLCFLSINWIVESSLKGALLSRIYLKISQSIFLTNLFNIERGIRKPSLIFNTTGIQVNSGNVQGAFFTFLVFTFFLRSWGKGGGDLVLNLSFECLRGGVSYKVQIRGKRAQILSILR